MEELEFPDWKEKLEGELASGYFEPASTTIFWQGHLEWHEIQAEKKNNASKKKAAEKGEDGEEETQGENEDSSKLGQPVAKKARLETAQKAGGIERTSLPTRPNTGEHTADEDAGDDEDPADDDEDDDEDEEPEERLEVEGHEDTQEVEAEDEALDNGEDSDWSVLIRQRFCQFWANALGRSFIRAGVERIHMDWEHDVIYVWHQIYEDMSFQLSGKVRGEQNILIRNKSLNSDS